MPEAERNAIFENWIGAHKAVLFRVARVYGATHADREDLFQEIALQLWHSTDAFRADAAVAPSRSATADDTEAPEAAEEDAAAEWKEGGNNSSWLRRDMPMRDSPVLEAPAFSW